MIRLCALALLVLLTSGCGADTGATDRSGATPPAQSAKASVAGSGGVTVSLPPGWHDTKANDGNVIDPVTRLVVASSPIAPRESECQIAAYDFAADAVAVVVVEWRALHTDLAERRNDFSTREVTIQPPPAIECFDGRGGSVQFVEQGRSFGAYLLAGREASDETIDQARGVLSDIEVAPRPSGQQLARNGVAVTVPTGWDGRMLYRDAPGSSGVIHEVANFELPPNEGLEPPAELPPGEEDPLKAMGDGDVLVTVSADAATGRSAPSPIALADLKPVSATRVPHGHSVVAGSFCFGDRCVAIEVDFGGATTPDLERRVGEVLASLLVENTGAQSQAAAPDGDPRGCPRANWPGPWTKCAEARWVARVVEAAGYRLAGETGSALIAENRAAEFYIWTTVARRPPADVANEGGWRHLGTSGGRAIYGDDDLWRLWHAQGFVFWLQAGPRPTSKLPRLDALEPLVNASAELAPPGP